MPIEEVESSEFSNNLETAFIYIYIYQPAVVVLHFQSLCISWEGVALWLSKLLGALFLHSHIPS